MCSFLSSCGLQGSKSACRLGSLVCFLFGERVLLCSPRLPLKFLHNSLCFPVDMTLPVSSQGVLEAGLLFVVLAVLELNL